MARRKSAWIWSLLVVFALAIPGYAQLNRGILEGTVTDPQGAAVPGVKVTVTAVDTNVVLPTTTNNVGYYRVVDLVPGKYQVHVEAAGFSPLDLTDIMVSPGQTFRQDAILNSAPHDRRLRSRRPRRRSRPLPPTLPPRWARMLSVKFPCRGETSSNSSSWCQG